MVKQRALLPTTGLYSSANTYILRAPALSARTFQRLSSTLVSEPASLGDPEHWLQAQRTQIHQMLLELSIKPHIALALAIASPSLYERLPQVRQGTASPQRTNKVFSSLLRYLIRMSTRPTPLAFSQASYSARLRRKPVDSWKTLPSRAGVPDRI